jgi:hypothetical protein
LEYRVYYHIEENKTTPMPTTRRRKKDPAATATGMAPAPAHSSPADLEILPIPAINKTAIAKARAQAITVTEEVAVLARDLQITTGEDYHKADEILHSIKVAGKRAEEPFEEVIGQVRPGLDKLYAIRRAVLDPLLDLEMAVKEKMRVWQIAERERIAKEERERKEREEKEERERRATAAAVDPVQAPSFSYASGIMQIIPAPFTPPPQPTRAASSTARPVRKWRVTDFALLLQAVQLGMVPAEAVQINVQYFNDQMRNDPAVIDTWPGAETFEDVQIIGR